MLVGLNLSWRQKSSYKSCVKVIIYSYLVNISVAYALFMLFTGFRVEKIGRKN